MEVRLNNVPPSVEIIKPKSFGVMNHPFSTMEHIFALFVMSSRFVAVYCCMMFCNFILVPATVMLQKSVTTAAINLTFDFGFNFLCYIVLNEVAPQSSCGFGNIVAYSSTLLLYPKVIVESECFGVCSPVLCFHIRNHSLDTCRTAQLVC
jgi:hypothetical protein